MTAADRLRDAAEKYGTSRTELDDAIREAAAVGISERQITELSGLARMTVRKVLGK